ncbi:MAG: hypothetical protein NBV56_01990 [Aquirufa antheringensis]|nr:hypothetical protein [Aquirufa antheringensis]
MAYITAANYKRIIGKINLKEVGDINVEVYKKPIYFLNKSELKYLQAMQILFKDPEKFAIEVYKPIINKDTLKYVFESKQPACYHEDEECPNLHSVFRNFEIPSEIKERVRQKATDDGKSESEILFLEEQQIKIFRRWFLENFICFKTDPEEFLRRLDIRWNVQRNVEEIERDNSGIESIYNLNLVELENEIDQVLREAGRYFTENNDKQDLIRRFQKLTFIAYQKGAIEINDTELSDDELREFLIEYDTKFKKPVKNLLIQYYRVKYNSELSFDGLLLDRLNFKPCSNCCESGQTRDAVNEFYNNEELLEIY